MPNNCWILAEGNLDAPCCNLTAIQHAVAGQLALRSGAIIAVTEIVLSAAIKGEIGGEDVPVLIEKSDQPTVVICVPVAEDQRIDFARIGPGNFQIVDQRLGSEPVVEHQRASLVRALRFDIQRQAPLVVPDSS